MGNCPLFHVGYHTLSIHFRTRLGEGIVHPYTGFCPGEE